MSSWMTEGEATRRSREPLRSSRSARADASAAPTFSPVPAATPKTTPAHSASMPGGTTMSPRTPLPSRPSTAPMSGAAAAGEGGNTATRLWPRATVGTASLRRGSDACQSHDSRVRATGALRCSSSSDTGSSILK